VATVNRFEARQAQSIPATLAAIQRSLEAAGVEFVPENGGGAGVRLRRYRTGDLVRFRHLSSLRLSYDVGPDEVGTVVYVEPHPTPMGSTYRISVEFPRAMAEGVLKTEFELVKAVHGGG
jgi:hypothetical protein